MEYKSKVYILTDNDNRIIRLDGGYTTPSDLTGWIEIDEGEGDRYNLCQSHYLPSPLYTEDGIPCWKWTGTECVLCSAEEIAADRKAIIPVPTAEERIAELEATNAMLTECLLEISEIIYA